MNLFSTFFISLLVSMVLVPPLMRYAAAMGLIDEPDSRKVHEGVIPRSGGIAIVVGSLLPVLIWWPEERLVQALVVGALIIAGFGLMDDRRPLHYGWKFFGQLLAVLIVTWSGLRIEVLPFLGIEPVPGYISIPLTMLFVVGVTNAINLSDGLDGLAAGSSLIALAAIAWLFYQSDALGMATLSLAMLGGICGFLRYNNHPALVFMGDTGSQFLGFVTAVLAIILTQRTNLALNPALLLLLLGLPILDTLTVMVWRLRTGRSPFLPDRNHFHHRLLDFGLHHYEAVSAIYLAQAILVTTAVVLRFESDLVVVGTYLFICALILGGFRLMRVRNMRIRPVGQEGQLRERRNRLLRRFPGMPETMTRATEVLAAGFLLIAAFYPLEVGRQFGILCAVLAVITIFSRMLPARFGDYASRFSVYMAGVCAVTALIGESRFPVLSAWHIHAYTVLLAVCLIFAIRMTRREQFHTTPLDLLILFFVVTVVVFTSLSADSLDRYHLADTAIRLAVLFYASEFLSSQGRPANLVLPVAAVASLSLLAARGLA